MPTEDVTIRINTVLGTTSGGPQGAQQAQAAGQQAGNAFIQGLGQAKRSGGKTAGGKFLSILEGIGGSAASGNALGLIGMLGKGLGIGALGAIGANIGQQIGVMNTMSNMGLSGGDGLRGQGIYGTVMGVKDWFTGRSARESVLDLARQQGDFGRSQLQQRLQLDTILAQRGASLAYAPITQPDRFAFAREQREQLAYRQRDMERRRDEAVAQHGRYVDLMNQGRYLDIKTGKTISQEQALKTAEMLQQQGQEFQSRIEDISGQRRQFEFAQKGERLGTLFGARQAWGGMRNEEQFRILNIAQRLKQGGVDSLAPDELESLQGLGIFDETLQNARNARAEGGPFKFDQIAQLGDRGYAKAAAAKIQFGGTIEHHLDEAAMASAQDKMTKSIYDAGNEIAQRLTDTAIKAGAKSNEIQVNKQLIVNKILKEF